MNASSTAKEAMKFNEIIFAPICVTPELERSTLKLGSNWGGASNEVLWFLDKTISLWALRAEKGWYRRLNTHKNRQAQQVATQVVDSMSSRTGFTIKCRLHAHA